MQIADGTARHVLPDDLRPVESRNTVVLLRSEDRTQPFAIAALLNGDTVEGKIRDGGLIKRMLKEGKTPEQVIETIYVRCLTRKPTPDELTKSSSRVAEEQHPQRDWKTFSGRCLIRAICVQPLTTSSQAFQLTCIG